MAKKKTNKAKETNAVLVNVILDRSGSMSSTRAATVDGYNEYLNGLRADKKTDYSVTLIQFDSPTDGPELTVKYVDKPLAEVASLSLDEYEPRGMTPLYDAIGECIRRVEAKGRLVITVVITDGAENASREFTKDAIQALVKEKTDKEHWTFVFLGADIDSYAMGSGLGYSAGNTANYTKGREMSMFSNLVGSTVMRSAMVRTQGIAAANSTNFFDNSQRASMGDDVAAKANVIHQYTPSTTVSSGSGYLSPTDVADALGLSSKTVYSALKRGTIPAVRVGRSWRVKREDMP